MQEVKFGEKLNRPVVVCLGYFACMHKGHLELLETARKLAGRTNAKVALFTFSNNHLRVLGKDDTVLYTYPERLSIYKSLDIDYVISCEFDADFRALKAEQFLTVLKNNCSLSGIVCGYDHHCGSDRMDCNGICKFFENICPVEVVNEISFGNEKISTTLIKKMICSNKIGVANSLLTEPFFLTGRVTHGRGVGKSLGFPTANVAVDREKLLPLGVYAGRVAIGSNLYKCIVNIGQVPTFDIDGCSVEVHIISFDGDLYGKEIKVSLVEFLRGIVKFDSANELAKQLKIDKERALNDQIRSKRELP